MGMVLIPSIRHELPQWLRARWASCAALVLVRYWSSAPRVVTNVTVDFSPTGAMVVGAKSIGVVPMACNGGVATRLGMM